MLSQQEIESWRLLQEYSDDVLWIIGPDLKTRYISPSVQRQLGYTPEEYMAMTMEQRLPRESYETAINALRQNHAKALELARQKQRHSYRIEILHRHKDGRLGWGEVLVSFIYDEDWNIIGHHGVSRNIDDRKRIENALRESEAQHRALFERMMSGCAIVEIIRDPQGRGVDYRFLDMNPALQSHLGVSRDHLVGRMASEAMPGYDRSWLDALNQILDTGQAIRFERYSTWFKRHLDVVGYALSRDRAAVLFEDITRRKLAEEEIQKSRKLESLGVLAGGIAHDFRNILTGIVGNLNLVRRLLPGTGEASRLLASAEKACDRARNLTMQLLTFSRGGEPVKQDAALDELIQETATFVTTGSNVRCEFDLDAHDERIEVDSGQIGQVIQNLVLNAMQVMPDGGVIRISSSFVDLEDGAVPLLPAGRYARIEVRDQGPGIPHKDRGRIFDPYFTTRLDGSGLGLSVAYSIVRRHDGRISVDSEPGEGASFTVYLPSGSVDRARESAEPSETRSPDTGRTGRILVMDDDDAVREVLHRMLKVLGYEPSVASNGQEAVRMFRKQQAAGMSFDLVLMDLTVPGRMGGKAAIQEILALDAQSKAVVMSGYSQDPVMSRYREHGFVAVLEKPIRLDDLARVLDRAMTQEPPPPL